MRPTRDILLPLLLLALATGCSSTRLAYNNADWLIKREIARDSCPSSDQEDWLEAELDKLHVWHRRQELPRYALTLRQVAAGLAPGQSEASRQQALGRLFDGLEQAGRRFGARLAGPAGTYLSTLSGKQHQCMTRGMIRRYGKYAADLRLSHARYIRRQRDKLEDRLDDWIGDLTVAQQREVDRLIAQRKRTHHKVTLAWRTWSWRVITMLQRTASVAERARQVRAAIKDRFHLYNKPERAVLRQWDEANRQITRAVVRLMSGAQRTRLNARLLNLAGALEAISRE